MVDEQQIQQPVQQSLVEQPKKNRAWIWWLVGALVLIGAGIGVYFLLSGDSSLVSNFGGNSIPQPPALPE